MQVGFIGLGAMGRPMAKNLLKGGHSLTVFARRAEVRDEFASLGARVAGSPAEVARASDVVISIVTADAQVREVALGPDGIRAGAKSGLLYIDMSTIGPDTVAEVAAALSPAGVSMLDAPVSGGPWGAEAGTLSIMAGGAAADFERAKPVFESMGKKLFHLGPLGAGQTAKLVNQLIAGGIMCLIGEGLALAAKAGANLEMLADVIGCSSGNSSVFEARGKKFVLAGNYQPGFMTELMRKDVGLALDLAYRLQTPMPVTAAALEQYTVAMAQGLGAEDFAAVAKVCQQAAGLTPVAKR